MLNFEFKEPTFTARQQPLAICQSIYDGNAFNTQKWRDGYKNNPEMLPDSVIKFLNLLDNLKSEYCIVGGIAYLAYIEDRNTKDLDILISAVDLNKVLPFVEIINQDANFTNAIFDGLRIDFLKTSNALFDYVKNNETTEYGFAEGHFPIATVNGLILMRFDAIIDLYQKGNFAKAARYEWDLSALTRSYEIDWNYIWKISKQFFTARQIEEFQKLVEDWQKPRRNPFI